MSHSADVVLQDGTVTALSGPAGDVPWWSFSKTVIAAAALKLVDEGKLTLDAPLARKSYTIRHLLQHRAGLTDYGHVPAYHEAVARREDAWQVDELLARADADRLLYRPGEGWAYSNIGYLFVRQLIEETCGAPWGDALARLVLRPLGIEAARLAMRRDDLAAVEMGETRGYDPRWVYHGLLVGPLRDAACLLHRLMTGKLLPPDLLVAMMERHPVGGPIAGRPWNSPGYGLGLMTGSVAGGLTIAGHTGSGPGSVIAVYHLLSARPARTVAAFSMGDDQGDVENRCVLSSSASSAKKEPCPPTP